MVSAPPGVFCAGEATGGLGEGHPHDIRHGLVKIEEKPEVRKAGGVYYTPTYIVDYIVKNTVGKCWKM